MFSTEVPISTYREVIDRYKVSDQTAWKSLPAFSSIQCSARNSWKTQPDVAHVPRRSAEVCETDKQKTLITDLAKSYKTWFFSFSKNKYRDQRGCYFDKSNFIDVRFKNRTWFSWFLHKFYFFYFNITFTSSGRAEFGTIP